MSEGGPDDFEQTSYPLVSVTVPTFNSEDVIGGCLGSVERQSYRNIETIVIDSRSRDHTPDIAADYGARVIPYEGRLLGARHLGVLNASGRYVLLLDSDQILEPAAIERAVPMMANYDMLVFEELSYQPQSWLQKLFSADRQLVHMRLDEKSFDPIKASVLPRFFRREVLLRAFENIHPELLPTVVHPDHDIIYFEARKSASRIGVLRTAVYHREPSTLAEAWKKHFRYGRSLKELRLSGPYRRMARNWAFRRGSLRVENLGLGVQSILLTTFLSTARTAGYWLGARLA